MRLLMCLRFATIVNVMITNRDHELHLPRCTTAQAPTWFGYLQTPKNVLEPISKLLKQNAQGCKLHETEKVGRVVFPSNQEPTLPLNPRKEALDDPAPLIPTQSAAVLGFVFLVGAVRRN